MGVDMRFVRMVVAAAAVSMVAGCISAPPKLPLMTPFDTAQFAWSKAPGANTITGDAVLRTRGGDVKTCAGLGVELFPATPYTEEYVTKRFGSVGGGYADQYSILGGTFNLDPDFYQYQSDTTCDAQGRFSFAGLADGAYYVVATVTWEVPGSMLSLQGGDIAKIVQVAGGKTVSVTLTA